MAYDKKLKLGGHTIDSLYYNISHLHELFCYDT